MLSIMIKKTLFFILLLLSITCAAATQVKLITGGTYNIDDAHRETFRFDQSNKWAYGDSLFFLEASNALADGTSLYTEWSPRLSLSKVSGHKIRVGIIKDILIATQVNFSGTNFRAYLYGLGFALQVPYFKALGINVYNRNNPNLHGNTYQLTPYWYLPFNIKNCRFAFFGHADIAGSEGTTYRANQLFQPRLLLDVGNFFKHPNRVWGGVRWTYWHHIRGTDPSENVLEAMIMWNIA